VELDHRLRQVICERLHPRPAATRQDDRLTRPRNDWIYQADVTSAGLRSAIRQAVMISAKAA
jgi:hypothetical protein